MPDKDYCHMTIVLDRSGSMASVKNDTEGGFNSFIEKQKKVAGRATLTLVQFDTDYEFVYNHVSLEAVKPLKLEPRGSTALLDAIGRAINETGARLKQMDELDRPGKVLFVVLTDGEENASQEFSKERINEMITLQREQYRWTFVFIGANQDAIKVGHSMGVPTMNNLTYQNNAGGVHHLYASLNAGTQNLRSSHTSSTMDFFNEDDRDAQKKAGNA